MDMKEDLNQSFIRFYQKNEKSGAMHAYLKYVLYQKLADKLNKPIIKILQKRKVDSSFKDKKWKYKIILQMQYRNTF